MCLSNNELDQSNSEVLKVTKNPDVIVGKANQFLLKVQCVFGFAEKPRSCVSTCRLSRMTCAPRLRTAVNRRQRSRRKRIVMWRPR